MKRPEQHEIDTKAQRIFSSSIPSSWVAREQHPDYGIDYDVEVFKDGEPTGISFYVQLKGTSSPNFTENTLRFPFEVDKLIYYFEKVKKPTFLVVVDVDSSKAYWLFIQQYIQDTLNREKVNWHTQKTVTLHIPIVNMLPDSTMHMENFAKTGFEYVYLLLMGRPNLKLALAVQNKLNNIDAVRAAINQAELETGELKILVAERYLHEDKKEEAIAEFSQIYKETENQGSAVIHLVSATELIYTSKFIDKAENRKLLILIKNALKRKDECQYKSVVFLAEAAQYFLDIIFNFQQIRNMDIFAEIAKSQNRGTDQLLRMFQSEAFKEYDTAFNEMYSLVSKALEENELHAATVIMIKLSELYLFITPYLTEKKEGSRAKTIWEYAEKLIEIALESAKAINSAELICYALQSKSNLFFQQSKEYHQVLSEMLEMAIEENLPHFQQAAIKLGNTYEETGSIKNLQSTVTGELTIDQEIECFKALAKLDGIDLENEDDEISQVINVGIRDLNPERALKHCQHLYVAVVSYGLPGEMYGLPTAGTKMLYCDKSGAAIAGIELDSISPIFQEQYCLNCPDKQPYPQSWKWSRKWQQERDNNTPIGLKNTLDAMKNPRRTPPRQNPPSAD